jgi:hypothetical protein
MNLDVRIEQLRSQHQSLEDEIDQELARPAPDDLRVRTLKAKKLWIKDKIVQLNHMPAH